MSGNSDRVGLILWRKKCSEVVVVVVILIIVGIGSIFCRVNLLNMIF